MGNGRLADFRSDTVTHPTARMLEAMGTARVGDDVLGDDPTVKALEARFAELFGHEAAVFVPSGTMANQAAVAAHILPGEEVIVEARSHIFQYEGGGLARVAAAHVRTLPGEAGAMSLEQIQASIRSPSVHKPRTALICLEETHLFSGGAILPFHYLKEVHALASRHGIPIHLDGARILNAQAETGVPLQDYGSVCSSLAISLSKGLSCPVGSLLIGGGAFIERARRVRKWLGGGMRQAGFLAVCGLIALEEVLPLLAEDNARCRRLGGMILGLPGLEIAQRTIDTNILFVKVVHKRLDAPMVVAALVEHGVLALAEEERLLRFVTHRGVSDADVDRAVAAMQSVLETT